jgi:hypothetical protein
MTSEKYRTLLLSAIKQYTHSKNFKGYFYPGQFYEFTQSTTAFNGITGQETFRWMISLEDECAQFDGIVFSKLSPAKKGERSNTKTFSTLFSLARKWHQTKSKEPLAVFVAKGLSTDRRGALSELSRYFGGVVNLTYLVRYTKLDASDFPVLIRAHYKDLVEKLVQEKTTLTPAA